MFGITENIGCVMTGMLGQFFFMFMEFLIVIVIDDKELAILMKIRDVTQDLHKSNLSLKALSHNDLRIDSILPYQHVHKH